MLLTLVAVNAAWIVLTIYPWMRCPRCNGVYEERRTHAAAALSTAHREAILRWAEIDDCRHCLHGRISYGMYFKWWQQGDRWTAPW